MTGALIFLSLALVLLSVVYFRSKKSFKSALDASIFEKDSIIKNSIRLEEENNKLKERCDLSATELADSHSLTDKLREENKTLYAKVSALSAESQSMAERISSQKEDFELRLEKQKNESLQWDVRFKDAFENISSKMLEDRGKKFLEINRESIYGILNPLSEKINEFQKKVEETYDKESRLRFSLQSEIGKLVKTENDMKKATENLTAALKGSGKVQGDWGEMILEQLLENSGLIEGMQYEIQKEMGGTDEYGKKIYLRPDIIVHLPGGKDIIIDSKVSLTDYERYMTAYHWDAVSPLSPVEKISDENIYNSDPTATAGQIISIPDAAKHLKAHVASIKKHISELKTKNYSSLLKPNSLDAVVMFIPIEFAYTAAVNSEEGRDIINFAASKNVIIATPSVITLILKIVHNLWIQEKSMEKAAEVMQIAGQLYDKFCSFAENMESVGKSIDKSKESYDSAMGQLVSGRGNIIVRLKKMKQLGARTSKSLDDTKLNIGCDLLEIEKPES